MNRLTRRSFLAVGAKASLAGGALSVLAACGSKQAKVAACADASSLSASEQSQREGSHYVEVSADPAARCSGCTFFTAAEDGSACGQCKIFNGPANASGHCDSWAAKTA